MTNAVFPELIAGREDGAVPGPWTIERGGTMRGQASCNVVDRTIEVPLHATEQARVVRAHELMHARVSPLPDVMHAAAAEITPAALTTAEELRVNTLVGRLGFDTDQLMDGTEAIGAKNMAAEGDWPGVVRYFAAVMNTGAEKKYLAAVRKEQTAWAPRLRSLRTALNRHLNGTETSLMGSTTLNPEGIPVGFAAVTMRIAQILDRAAGSSPEGDADDARRFSRSLEPGGRRAPSGRFAALVMEPFEGAPGAPRNSVTAPRATNSGVHLRYPQRAITDPHRRVFASRVRVPGGIVVIDQSGSMDLDVADLTALVQRHPRVLIVGYSHRPGDLGTTPNAWILANRGQLAKEQRGGNVGNGVDGPVLRWALRQREGNEPVVWVCDGQVTDSNDHPVAALSLECAMLVRDHGIRLVRELRDVDATLRARSGIATDLTKFGRIGRALVEARRTSFAPARTGALSSASIEMAPVASHEL
jgi:hypothetical protein